MDLEYRFAERDREKKDLQVYRLRPYKESFSIRKRSGLKDTLWQESLKTEMLGEH